MPPVRAARRRARAGRGEVGSLLRGLAVLEALAGVREGASPRELITRTGFDRSTLQRLLRTLVAAGYVERVSRGHYRIATPALSLGAKLTRAHHLGPVARPYLLALQRDVGETVNLAVLDGVDVLYVSRFSTGQILTINLEVGARLPAYCTSLGRAILSCLEPDQARLIIEQSDRRELTARTKTDVAELMGELRAVSTRGYAFTDGELEVGLRSVAAPVLGGEGTVLAAINVSVPAARVTGAVLKRTIAPAVREAASSLSQALGGESRS